MSLGLHLRYQCFETTMGTVSITCQTRKIRVQIHFRTGKPSVAPVATDLKQLHPAFFEWSRASSAASCGESIGEDAGHHEYGRKCPSPSICSEAGLGFFANRRGKWGRSSQHCST